MKLTHSQVLPTDLETTWASFLDLERVGDCFPGARVTNVRGDDFDGELALKLGPFAFDYLGAGQMTLRDERTRTARLRASGSDRRGLGKATIDITVQLAPAPSGTRVDVTTELVVQGSPMNLGQSLAQTVSDPLVERFLTCMGDPSCSSGGGPLDVGRDVLPQLAGSIVGGVFGRLRGRR